MIEETRRMNDPRIRPAAVGEAQLLKEIGVRGWETTYSGFVREENRRAYLDGPFWSLDRLHEVLSDRDAINLVAVLDDAVVGFITTERLDDGRYEVTRLYVDPDSRGAGTGSRLLRAVFDVLEQRGIIDVLVNVFGDNHDGRRFYERHGFRLIEDTWTTVGDQRLSDVWYARRLGKCGFQG
jgi:ribosomal protein S18 acetylase RimI-like enzyme